MQTEVYIKIHNLEDIPVTVDVTWEIEQADPSVGIMHGSATVYVEDAWIEWHQGTLTIEKESTHWDSIVEQCNDPHGHVVQKILDEMEADVYGYE